MQIKRMSLRFDLDNPEDRQAWEYLRSLNTASMNRTVLSIHHVRKLKDLSGKVEWERHMIARKRKTLALCHDCHVKLHAGKLD